MGIPVRPLRVEQGSQHRGKPASACVPPRMTDLRCGAMLVQKGGLYAIVMGAVALIASLAMAGV